MSDFEATLDMPSLGVLNGSKETVQIRPMTVREEKILLSKSLTPGDKFLKIITSSSDIADPNEAKRLPMSDVMFLFIKLRNLSVGSSGYRNKVSCSMCDQSFQWEIDLNTQDVKQLKSEEEPYTAELPRCGKKVTLKHMRLQDQIDVDKMARTRKSLAVGGINDPNFLSERLAALIVSVDGNDKALFAEKCKFVDSLITQDMQILNDTMADHDFGIDLRTTATCPHCDSTDEYLVRLDPTFFRSPRKLSETDGN